MSFLYPRRESGQLVGDCLSCNIAIATLLYYAIVIPLVYHTPIQLTNYLIISAKTVVFLSRLGLFV